MTPDERERFDETQLVYSAATGKRPLRQAIADLHGVGVDEVQIVTGASEALLSLFFMAAQAWRERSPTVSRLSADCCRGAITWSRNAVLQSSTRE